MEICPLFMDREHSIFYQGISSSQLDLHIWHNCSPNSSKCILEKGVFLISGVRTSGHAHGKKGKNESRQRSYTFHKN